MVQQSKTVIESTRHPEIYPHQPRMESPVLTLSNPASFETPNFTIQSSRHSDYISEDLNTIQKETLQEGDKSDEASFEPTDTHYNFTTSGDPDLDYWVRSVEGPGHPLDYMDAPVPFLDPQLDQTHSHNTHFGASSSWSLDDTVWNDSTVLKRSNAGVQRQQHEPSLVESMNSMAPEEGSPSSQDEGSLTIESREAHVTKELSSRLGKLQVAEDGHLRYFGATSNLHILHSGPNSLSQPSIRTIQVHGKDAIINARLEWSRDLEYEEHVLDLFFAWHNPFTNVVDKSCYYNSRQAHLSDHDAPFYSPCLTNAMLAVGSAYGSRVPSSLPDKPSEFFSSRAKVYLDIEMDSPNLATVQALLILASHEAAQMRDSRGWMYMGMAVQLSFDLGLHLDLEDICPISSSVANLEMREARKNLFWTVNTSQILWSFSCGRPSLMKNLEYNIHPPSLRDYEWKYIAETNQMTVPSHAEFHVAGWIHAHLAELAIKMEKFANILYSGVSTAIKRIEPFVQDMANQCQEWKQALPSSLCLPENILQSPMHVPGVFELHLQYEEAIILLYRPFLSPSDSRSSHTTDRISPVGARRLCFKAATHISNILIVYRRYYGLKRVHVHMVHVVMSAALIHTYICTVFSGKDGTGAEEHLLTCLQALGEMGQTFKSASRALEIITSLRNKWRKEALQGVVGERQHSMSNLAF